MSIADRTDPFERFMDPRDREHIVSSLQNQYKSSVGSDEVEDAYSHMLEQLAGMAPEDIAAIDTPYTWLYVGMRNRLRDRAKSKSAADVHYADLPDVDDDFGGSFLSDNDDSVVGSLVGRETAAERLAEIAELVWSKFTGQDAQLAARILLEHERPNVLADELGLDKAYVVSLAHKANQAQRLLEEKVKEDPEFRCWRLRKHMTTYYKTGEVSLALRAHWMTCGKCKAAERKTQEHTHRVLAPFLPIAAAPAGLLGLLRHAAHHILHPVRSLRRAIRPAAQLGGKTAAGSTQMSGIAGAVTSKVAVVAVAAAVTAGGASAVVVVHHLVAHHPTPIVKTTPTATTPAPVVRPVTTPVRTTTVARKAPVVHHPAKHKTKTKPKHKRKRRTAHHITHTVTTPPVAATPPVTTTTTPVVTTTATATTTRPVTTTTPAATTTTPAATTTTSTPPATTTSSSSSRGQVTNPSYQTPSAP